MTFFELESADIKSLNDGDLRELVARLVEAELVQHGIPTSCVTWGGAQEAADGGLDVSVKSANGVSSTSFVPRERTGYQVKKHLMGKTACFKEMRGEDTPKAIIAELASQSGAYIIVSGYDDCSDKMLSERLEGMKNAVFPLTNKEQLHLDFYGRDRLCTWLRRHPSVALWTRSRLGKPLTGWRPYERWAATPPDQNDDFLIDDHPCVIDTSDSSKEPQPILAGIQLVRTRLETPGSIVRITGLSGVGKTRFAQALFETKIGDAALPHSEAIYADLGENLTPTASELVTYLIANDIAAYLVLDNCPPDVHRTLQQQVAANQAKLRLLTLEYDISDDKPEETRVIHLEPSSEATVSVLLQRRFPSLGRVNADRVAEFAGGNARISQGSTSLRRLASSSGPCACSTSLISSPSSQACMSTNWLLIPRAVSSSDKRHAPAKPGRWLVLALTGSVWSSAMTTRFPLRNDQSMLLTLPAPRSAYAQVPAGKPAASIDSALIGLSTR
ncbi:hypothetical protein HNQ50_000346 [Silvimonas terrae]|uniref:Uncharacterized protein n=1 Tax=Silvimonas terrae TaxID=300266 RepID=A0A840RB04_9NEIS|nr:hypothetical protein [Silvimonas terrae]